LALLLVVVLGQRLALPLGGGEQVPAALVLALMVVGAAVLRGRWELDPRLTRLYAIALGAVLAQTFVHLVRGNEPSLLSVAFLAALYLPWALRTPPVPAADVARILDVFVRVMAVLAVVGIAQAAV